MQYPYRVSVDDTDIGPTTSYHRTAESCEGAILKLLRAGRSPVRVTYLRRALVTFDLDGNLAGYPADTVVYPDWFLLTGQAGFDAREAVWKANGSPMSGGAPVMPNLPVPSAIIRAAVSKLGPAVEALPRGRAQRNAAGVLVAQFGIPEADALKIVGALKGYLK